MARHRSVHAALLLFATAATWSTGWAQQDPLDAFKSGNPQPVFGPQPGTSPGSDPFSLLNQNAVPVESSSARMMRQVRDFLGNQKFKEAIDVLNQVIAAEPQNVEALEDRAYGLAVLSKFPEAEKDLATLKPLAPANDTHYYLTAVSVYSAEKKFMEAANVITAALALSPKEYKLLLTRADFYNAAKAYDKAYDDATEAMGLAPDEPETYQERSSILSNQGRTEEAVDDLSQAILLRPDDANAFSNRAILEDKIGDHRAEFADLKTALKLDPKSPVTLNGMAWYLAICFDPKQRDGARAVTLATQACDASQWKDGGIVDTLAAAQAEIGKFDLAVKNQTKAIALSVGQDDVLPEMKRRLELYKQNKPYHEAAIDPSTLEWSQVRYQTFMTVWQTVNDAYYDVTFGGVDWQKLREKYRSKLDSVANNDELRQLLRSMLGELHRTHFAVIPREGAVFNPSERVRIGTVGADLSFSNGSPIISTIEKGSAASTGGLKAGDQVVSVNGTALAPVAETLTKNGVSQTRAGLYLDQYVESFLTGNVGSKVELKVKSPDGKVRPVTLTCAPNTGEWSEPIGYFPSIPIRVEALHEPDGVDYLKFNAFVPPVMKQIRAFMKTVKPSEGLIIDLRGNSGGVSLMAAGIAGLLCHDEFSMGTMHLRDGAIDLDVYPQAHIFDGPVAVLIDRSSASTSEIFAAGIKESHRAQVFGETSPGMALPSLFKSLPTGDLLQYAIADVTTPTGITIEGTGVEPNHPIAMSREDMAAGRDPVMDAAKAWIESQRHPQPLAKAP